MSRRRKPGDEDSDDHSRPYLSGITDERRKPDPAISKISALYPSFKEKA